MKPVAGQTPPAARQTPPTARSARSAAWQKPSAARQTPRAAKQPGPAGWFGRCERTRKDRDMPVYFYDPPARFVAGTVGQPGERTFYLQASGTGRVTSVTLEKQQVSLLAGRPRCAEGAHNPGDGPCLRPAGAADCRGGPAALPAVRPAARCARPHLPAAKRPPPRPGRVAVPKNGNRPGGKSRLAGQQSRRHNQGMREPGSDRARRQRDSVAGRREAVLDLLTNGPIEVEGQLFEASNATLYCRIRSGDMDVACVYKPVAGERPLWDFPHGSLAGREVAAYAISEAAGWEVVPPTVYRDGPFGPGMCQLWIDADTTVDLVALARRADHAGLRDMAVFDAVVNNADRKIGHLLPTPAGHLFGCDHGVCFSEDYKLRTVLWQWRGRPRPGRRTRPAAVARRGRSHCGPGRLPAQAPRASLPFRRVAGRPVAPRVTRPARRDLSRCE